MARIEPAAVDEVLQRPNEQHVHKQHEDGVHGEPEVHRVNLLEDIGAKYPRLVFARAPGRTT